MSTAAASKPSELCPASRGLSFLDRYLTLWIFLAMALGVGLGFYVPGVAQAITRRLEHTIPIAIACRYMYPPWQRSLETCAMFGTPVC